MKFVRAYMTVALPLIMAVTVFFASCEQETSENKVIFVSKEVDCNSTGQFVSIISEGAWNISIDEIGSEWCAVTPESGIGSRNNVVLSYSVNNNQDLRKAVISVLFENGELIVTEFVQAGFSDDSEEPDDPDNPGLFSDPVYSWMELPEVKSEKGFAYVFHHAEAEGRQVRNYSMYYDAGNRIALWVAYPLCAQYMGSSGRTDAWNYDPKIPQEFQPDLFGGWPVRGYDRGHQLPSGSRNVNAGINRQTFYFTNMTAQVSSFNQGLWANVENRVRGYASSCDTLYVVTGPVLTTDSDSEIEYVTDNSGNEVALPKAYFKVLMKYNVQNNTYYSIGYYYENKSYDRREPVKSDLKTVAQIESITGMTFFPNLPDDVKSAVKQQYEPGRWGF